MQYQGNQSPTQKYDKEKALKYREEIRREKRARRIALGQQYLVGSTPLISTACLRGPFEKGWQNPWQRPQSAMVQRWSDYRHDQTRPIKVEKDVSINLSEIPPSGIYVPCSAPETCATVHKREKLPFDAEVPHWSPDRRKIKSSDKKPKVKGNTWLRRPHNNDGPRDCYDVRSPSPLATRTSRSAVRRRDTKPSSTNTRALVGQERKNGRLKQSKIIENCENATQHDTSTAKRLSADVPVAKGGQDLGNDYDPTPKPCSWNGDLFNQNLEYQENHKPSIMAKLQLERDPPSSVTSSKPYLSPPAERAEHDVRWTGEGVSSQALSLPVPPLSDGLRSSYFETFNHTPISPADSRNSPPKLSPDDTKAQSSGKLGGISRGHESSRLVKHGLSQATPNMQMSAFSSFSIMPDGSLSIAEPSMQDGQEQTPLVHNMDSPGSPWVTSVGQAPLSAKSQQLRATSAVETFGQQEIDSVLDNVGDFLGNEWQMPEAAETKKVRPRTYGSRSARTSSSWPVG